MTKAKRKTQQAKKKAPKLKENKSEITRKWLGLVFSALGLGISLLVITASASFFMGGLSSRMNSLERTVKLRSGIIRYDINGLKNDIAVLRGEVLEDIQSLRGDITVLKNTTPINSRM